MLNRSPRNGASGVDPVPQMSDAMKPGVRARWSAQAKALISQVGPGSPIGAICSHVIALIDAFEQTQERLISAETALQRDAKRRTASAARATTKSVESADATLQRRMAHSEERRRDAESRVRNALVCLDASDLAPEDRVEAASLALQGVEGVSYERVAPAAITDPLNVACPFCKAAPRVRCNARANQRSLSHSARFTAVQTHLRTSPFLVVPRSDEADPVAGIEVVLDVDDPRRVLSVEDGTAIPTADVAFIGWAKRAPKE